MHAASDSLWCTTSYRAGAGNGRQAGALTWEAVIVLRDIRGLDDARARDVSTWVALAPIDAALAADA